MITIYSSIPLVENLYSRKIIYCGTLRNNRKGIPKTFNKKLKRGETLGKEKNNVKIIKWFDKRPVLMITSDPTHNETVIPTGKSNRSGEEVLKPKCFINYNKAKKGVDFSDQMSSYHSAIRKGIKWYRKVMFELLLGTAVVNSWIVFNELSETKLSITEFRRQLAENLVTFEEPKKDTNVTKKRVHTFVRPEGPGRKKRKPCKGCYEKLRETVMSREADKKVRRVISYCQDCIGNPGFCLTCFNHYHK